MFDVVKLTMLFAHLLYVPVRMYIEGSFTVLHFLLVSVLKHIPLKLLSAYLTILKAPKKMFIFILCVLQLLSCATHTLFNCYVFKKFTPCALDVYLSMMAI